MATTDDVLIEYSTPKRKAKVITFIIDGEEYHFTPPKDATVVMPVVEAKGDESIAATRAQFDWLSAGLPEEENDRIVAKLKDDDDDFDVPDLEHILDLITKKVNGGRPTS